MAWSHSTAFPSEADPSPWDLWNTLDQRIEVRAGVKNIGAIPIERHHFPGGIGEQRQNPLSGLKLATGDAQKTRGTS